MTVAFRVKGLCLTLSEYDALFEEHDKKTLGQLLKRARTAVAIPTEVDALLEDALEKRNWLAHQYFADRSVPFTEKDGRSDMIRELQQLTILFKKADTATVSIYQPVLRQMGVTDEKLNSLMDEMKREYRAEKATLWE
jgi:RecB family exonuclease